MKVRLLLAALIGFGIAAGAPVSAQEPFYKGKVVRTVVGFSPGGGFDSYSRVIARHMGKHIPGNPTMIVENMPGAGGLILMNHLFKAAKPDGLTVGHIAVSDFLVSKLLGRPGIDVDFLKYRYVGGILKDFATCALNRSSGIGSVEQWMAAKTPPKLGSTSPGSFTDNIPRVLAAAAGLPGQTVTGFKGTADIRLAVESGELSGACITWGSMRATWRNAIDSGQVVIVLQNRAQPHPDLPRAALMLDLAKTREARELLQASDQSDITYTYALPPGTPEDRVQALRKAFADTMRDAEFLQETEKSRLSIDPMTGEEMEKRIAQVLQMNPATAARLKQILAPQ